MKKINGKSNIVMIVDDEELNLKILDDELTYNGYNTACFSNPVEAFEYLQKNGKNVKTVLLDRMMPQMDGMEFFHKMLDDNKLGSIPVIMQTAADYVDQVQEGIEAGVYYYITKPFSNDLMLAIVRTAFSDSMQKKIMLDGIKKHRGVLGYIEHSRFKFKTIEQGKNIAYLLSNYFPDPEIVVAGLVELIINAVEHGSLGITYEEKRDLLLNGDYIDEIERRSKMKKYADKEVTVCFYRTDHEAVVYVEDEGAGFDWIPYMELHPDRVTSPNGRGIAIANMLSFDDLEYIAPGNKVIGTVEINED